MIAHVRALGIGEVTAEYEGYGDSGNVEDVTVQPAEVQLPEPLATEVGDFAWSLAYHHHPGFEHHEGGYGTLTWTLQRQHHARSRGPLCRMLAQLCRGSLRWPIRFIMPQAPPEIGGVPSDYQSVHDWFDASKEHHALFTHRAMRHHAQGLFEAERVFGVSLTNSAVWDIPVLWIGEQHVREDCQGRIPSMADWLRRIQPEPWMANGHIDRHVGDEPCGDPRVAWASEVAAGRTVLGLKDWMAARAMQATQGA